MKLALSAFLCLIFAACALAAQAVTPEKQIIVSYPQNTPEHVLESAKNAIEQAGGIIVHEYSLIKGFAAKTSDKIIDTISTLGSEYNVLVEEDQVVGVNGAS